MLLTLSYVSVARRPVHSKELAELAEKYRRNNARNDITGMLLYHDLRFMQVIEGPMSNIRTLFENIKSDPLHDQILKIFEDPIQNREFLNWSLGVVNGSSLGLEDQTLLNRFLEDAGAQPTTPGLAGQGSRMLRHFRNAML